MTPFEQLAAQYGQHGISLHQYVRLHLKSGFVFSTPEYFVMGRPVPRTVDPSLIRNPNVTFTREQSDAWWIHGMAGDMGELIRIMPWPLEWIGFERFDEFPRFYKLERLLNRVMQGAEK